MDGGRHRLARRRRLRRWLLSIAPEMVAGASDYDPTNVGTAVVVGAQSAYRLAWVALLVAPLLAVVLTIAARLGSVTGSDLQSLTRRRYGWRVAAILLASVVAVNVVTIAADIQAGAAGIGLLAGLDPRWIVVPLAGALAALLLIGRYDQVEAVLRYLRSVSWPSPPLPSWPARTGPPSCARAWCRCCRCARVAWPAPWPCSAPR